ncbi:MAG TPA: hypothetical protein VEG24_06210, partial [Gaiellaceae bacterium]|nr:hypothetical protein [Gaiellaceae bacterium]
MEGVRLEGPAAPVTRVRPPHVRRDLVSRPRLLELLESGAGRRLTLVSAPAGFGKTTLLAEWAPTAGRPVAWLSLDETDGDPAALWDDVAEALGHAVPGFRPGGDAGSADAVLATLGARRGPVALVLDRYERIADAPCTESLWRFVGDAPPSLQIVVSGRAVPPFPVDDVLEIGTGDLRMTDVEAAELLHRALGGSLAVREVLRQIDRCEGWPAALRLVAESPDADLTELVLRDILDSHPEELDFLLRTSVLDELSGPLCDAVLGTSGAATTLRRIERENLLVEPVADRGERYRLHGELRRVLQAELERTAPELVPTLHLRAAAWLRRAGEGDAAIEHALLGGGWAEARRGIARSWRRHVDEGGQARVLGRLERMPEELVAGDPRLGLVRAWLLLLDGRRDE